MMSRLITFIVLLCMGTLKSTVVADPKLRWKRKSSGARLGECEGDCNRDRDCRGDLSCFKRGDNDSTPVPGCEGVGRPGRDYCYDATKGEEGEGPPPRDAKIEKIRNIKHIGTSRAYVTGNDIYQARIKIPSGAEAGDLLVLVLHRTDDYLPMGINGWTRAAECFKSNNGRPCATYLDCKFCSEKKDLVDTTNVFCEKFSSGGHFGGKTDGSGKDLAQAIFYKVAGKRELNKSTLKVNFSPKPERTHPAWMFLSVIRGADKKDPIRDWNATGNDGSTYSNFPSVYGKKGDLVLVSQGFDSGAPGVREGDFLPPRGFQNYVSMFDCDNEKSRTSKKYKCDESGYLFGKVLNKSGNTGTMTTRGNGRWEKSDSLVSVSIMPSGGSRDEEGRGASEWLGTNGKNCPKSGSRPT